MHRFYQSDITESHTLSPEESGHAVRVLRLGVGDKIEVVDGCGNMHLCHIVDPHPKHCYVEIDETTHISEHWECKIVLGIAPTKNLDRMEWMTEKCVEAGINAIMPMKCRFSERKELKTERLEKIAVSAMKQSLKTVLPEITPMTPIEKILAMPFDGQKFIAYCGENVERRLFAREYIPHSNVLILIGPEGDFSPEEVDAAIKNGFIPVSLGESRLRTETAAVFSVFAIHAINQRI